MKAFAVNPAFKYVFVHLTNRCNLSCSHCYVNSSPGGEFGLSKHTVKNIIDGMAKLENDPVFILSGGEPLSRRQDCADILKYACPVVRTKLFTNGTLFDESVSNLLAVLQPEIRISIDGSDEQSHDEIRGKGTFIKVLNGIQKLFSAGYPKEKLALCATLVDFNASVISEFLTLATNIGIHNFRFNALCRRGRGSELAERAYGYEGLDDIFQSKQLFSETFSLIGNPNWSLESLDDKNSVFSTVNIYADGSVFPFIPHDHMHPRPHEICAGNVNNTMLYDIIKGAQMQQSVLKKFLAYSISINSFSRAYQAKFITT